MKFLRVGELNEEKPAIIDSDGAIRDLSSIIDERSRIVPLLSITPGFSWFISPTLKNFISKFGGPTGIRTPIG